LQRYNYLTKRTQKSIKQLLISVQIHNRLKLFGLTFGPNGWPRNGPGLY
jgi:hypothetical protein